MLNRRRLPLLAVAICFIVLTCYTLGGPRGYVVLIPSGTSERVLFDDKQAQQGKGHDKTQPDTAAEGHHGSGNGHEKLHNAPGVVGGSGANGGAQQPAAGKGAASSPSSSSQQHSSSSGAGRIGNTGLTEAGTRNIEFVVSATKATNTSWIGENFPNVPAHIYIADDPKAPFTVLKNIGHESNVYLTYIIDHYDDLPEIVVFLHGRRYQWHNEDPLYDGVPPLKKLRIPYVLDHGFSTLRCSWLLGCPLEIKPDPSAKLKWDDPNADQRAKTEAAYAKAFMELFPKKPLPEAVGVHCGAQFAATRQRILANSRADYVNYRDWLWTTELTDEFSGRVMEYSWHQILGAPAVDCPHAGKCFCEKFGMCNLKECHDYGCEKTYFFNFGELPAGWPDEGTGKDGWPVKEWAEEWYVPPPPPGEKEKEAAKKEEAKEEQEGQAETRR